MRAKLKVGVSSSLPNTLLRYPPTSPTQKVWGSFETCRRTLTVTRQVVVVCARLQARARTKSIWTGSGHLEKIVSALLCSSVAFSFPSPTTRRGQ